jgi:hypothetical protein
MTVIAPATTAPPTRKANAFNRGLDLLPRITSETASDAGLTADANESGKTVTKSWFTSASYLTFVGRSNELPLLLPLREARRCGIAQCAFPAVRHHLAPTSSYDRARGTISTTGNSVESSFDTACASFRLTSWAVLRNRLHERQHNERYEQ